MPCWCAGKCPHVGRAQAFLDQKQPNRARTALRHALSVAPLCVESNLMFAGLLSQNNQAHAAMTHIDRAAQQGEPGRILLERARVHRSAMNLPAAQESFYAAMQADPESEPAAGGLIGALEMEGLLKEAGEVWEAARAKFPGSAELRRVGAVIADAQGNTALARSILTSTGGTGTPELMPVELLDRGRYKEKLGDYAGAWDDWMLGKTLMRERAGHIYDKAYHAKFFDALRVAGTAPRPNFYRRAPELESDPAPLFICGFPRSGTTLAETIFSSHSAVIAGDELMGIADAFGALPALCKVRMPYPAAMAATSLGDNSAVPALLRDLYMASAQDRLGFTRRRRPPAPDPAKKRSHPRPKPWFFTDKMPLNELHLPFLRLLFPTAPVIRMQRHPLDVMVSCMSNWLIHGGFYAGALESCAEHYRAVDDLLQHYEKQFAIMDRGTSTGLTWHYENLVEHPEDSVKAILAYAGLPFEKACLAPQKNKRTSRTLSYRAVKQPIGAGAVGRWKNFRGQLAPAVEILRSILEREGYEF